MGYGIIVRKSEGNMENNEVELTKVAIDYLKTCENFVLDQAPDIIKQVLNYKIVSNWFSVGVSLFFLILLICIALFSYINREYESYGGLKCHSFLFTFIPSMFTIIFFVNLIHDIDILIKLYISPKMYLLEYFVNLKR